MKIRSLTKHSVAVAVLATFAISGSALANDTTNDYGTIPDTYTVAQVIQHEVGSFNDIFSFNIDSPLTAGGSMTNLAISFGSPPVTTYNVTDLSAQLYSGTSSGTNFMLDDLGTGSYLTGSGRFETGDYFFKVSGTADGTMGGQYVFAVAAAPVPEPESYAMLLAGLGVMGTIVMRRNKSKKQG